MALQQEKGHEEYRWLAALFVMTTASVGAAYWMGAAVGVPIGSVLFGYATILWLMIPPIVVIAMLPWGVRALLLRAERPWDDFKPFMSGRFGSRALTCGTVGPILLMPMLIGAFGCLKQIMPLTRPFTWDDRFAELDRLLFLAASHGSGRTQPSVRQPQHSSSTELIPVGWRYCLSPSSAWRPSRRAIPVRGSSFRLGSAGF